MSLKFLIATVLLLALAAAAWHYRGEAPLKRILPREWQGAAPPAAAGIAPAAAPEGLRKCRQGGKLLYTTGDCPKGSVEQAISGGSVTVVPGPQPVATPAGAAGGAPDLGKLMGKDAATELRDKRMDRETSK